MSTSTLPTLDLTAADVMTTQVLAVPSDMPVTQVAQFLIDNNISGAPVVDDQDLLKGVVSLTDIARHDGVPMSRRPGSDRHEFYLRHEIDSLTDYGIEDLASYRIFGSDELTASQIMTPTVFNVLEDTPVQTVADHMLRGRIHRQFVTRDHTVVGVITAMDLVKIVRDLP